MNKVIHKAESRGMADHGWLRAKHTFSFANYYNPERIHFGVLRVLNDDVIAPGMGFGKHPHDNMEIITIPLKGAIEHKDSLGNTSVIKAGEIQVMSAGSGIFHSEYNASKTEELNLFQIWIFTNKKNVEPRYQQKELKDLEVENDLYQVLSPNIDDKGVWIYQNAWFSMGKFTKSWKGNYTLNSKGNGIYLIVINGKVEVAGEKLSTRDAIGLSDINELEINANKDSEILLMEIPMN